MANKRVLDPDLDKIVNPHEVQNFFGGDDFFCFPLSLLNVVCFKR